MELERRHYMCGNDGFRQVRPMVIDRHGVDSKRLSCFHSFTAIKPTCSVEKLLITWSQTFAIKGKELSRHIIMLKYCISLHWVDELIHLCWDCKWNCKTM